MTIIERATGNIYEDTLQCVDINYNGKYVMRHNIGRHTYHNGWVSKECIYDNKIFNEKYSVVKE